MMRDLVGLLGGTLVCWLLTALPAALLGAEDALLDAGVAAALCGVPAALTLVWCQWSYAGSPERQLLAVMGGTAVRMVVVLGAGMALFHTVPAFHRVAFWFWVIGFYLVTLALEVGLVVRRQTPAGQPRVP